MAITPNPNTDSYIDKIIVPSGDEFPIVDMLARQTIDSMSSYTAFLGVTTSNITDGTTSPVVVIDSQSVTATTGNIVIVNTNSTTAGRIAQEYIYANGKWQLFGDISADNLGNLAYKNSATGSFTPAGKINTTTGVVTSKGIFQPAGNITFTTASKTVTIATTSTAPTGSATANFWIYRPAGSVTASVTRTVSTANVLASVSGNTLVSNITTQSPTATAPTNGIQYAYVSDHKLQLYYLVKATKNAISSTGTTAVLTGVSVTSTSNKFTGTEIYVKQPSVVVPTAAGFTGTSATVTVTGTVIDSATFSGTAGTVTVS